MSVRNQILNSYGQRNFINKMNHKWQEKYKREQLYMDEIDGLD